MEIGSKLKDARNSKGLTQEQAAEALGVSRQTISNWENNRSYPDIISVIKMSGLYSVSLDHLLKDEKPMKEEKSMNQTYQEFLEESTNTVRAKRRLEKADHVFDVFSRLGCRHGVFLADEWTCDISAGSRRFPVDTAAGGSIGDYHMHRQK